MQLTEEQIEKIALDFVKKPGMHGYIEVGDLIDFASALLAAHSAGAQEPVAWRYQSEDPLDGGEWLLSDTKPNRRNIQPLYTHPQPMPQTDAARDAEDAKRYRFIKSQMKVGAVQTQLPLYRTLHWIGYEDCSDVHNADAVIDAEIECLDRAKGE